MKKTPLRHAFVAVSKTVFNAAYRLRHKPERKNEAVFLSRQANVPSYDFAELAREFESRGWQATMHLKKVTMRNLPAYVGHVLKEISLLARCKVAVLDRYDPVISLLNFVCERGTARTDGLHDEYPAQPVVIQLWHAFGAFKKFGYQSVGTREGHTPEVARIFNIHRNYTWIACSGEGAREAFAEAFDYPTERVIVLDRPEYDELLAKRAQLALDESTHEQPLVLMAPTLRKSKASEHPFRDLYAAREEVEAGLNAEVIWAFHPLEADLPAPGNVSDKLVACDLLVTDYSSTIYEAYLLGKMALFYIPDIESYLTSPGLNVNPATCCPDLCAYSAEKLAELVNEYTLNPDSYPYDQLDAFAASAFDKAPTDRGASTAASRFIDFAISCTE